MSIERRVLKASDLRAAAASKNMKIEGYAATFNTPTQIMDFQEVIRPGAFTRALKEKQDVRALVNHDPSRIIGRTKAGTLTLKEDKKGLFFSCVLPDNTMGRDLYESVKRGDISDCSFAFKAVKQNWTEQKSDDGSWRGVRELLDLDLLDVSCVVYPAYSGTGVNAPVEDLNANNPFEEPVSDDEGDNMEFSSARDRGLVLVAVETRARAHEIAQRPNWIVQERIRQEIEQEAQAERDAAFEAAVRETKLNAARLANPSQHFRTCEEYLDWHRKFFSSF